MGIAKRKTPAVATDAAATRLEEALQVSAELFAARGYRATSLADIGAALGMNKASLYYYVSSKEDLLRRLILRASSRLRHVSSDEETHRLPPVAALERLVREHCRVAFEHPQEFGLLVLQRRFIDMDAMGEVLERERAYVATLRGIIARGIADGVFRDIDPGIAAQWVLDSVNGLLRWYNPKGRLSRQEVADEMWRLIFGGLCASSTKEGAES